MIEMAYKTKEGTGSLFPNDNKKEDKHPDYTGKAMLNGKLMQVAGCINEPESGKRHLGLKFSDFKPRSDEEKEYDTTSSTADFPL